MALRVIREDGDEILRKISKTVLEVNDKILSLLDDMAETMKKNEGVGLAGPQIGVLKRIIVIDVGEGIVELIDPEFISQEGEAIAAEGCLSVPGVFGEVKRPAKVKVRGLNRQGKKVIIEGEGMLARVLCHEIDHLDGILFKDKVIKYLDLEGKKRR
jgi:peptide deformylase